MRAREDRTRRAIAASNQSDTAQGPAVKAKKAPSAPSLSGMGIWQLDTSMMVSICVAGIGKSEAHRRMEALRDQGHPELHLDYANMGRETGQSVTSSGGQIIEGSLVDHTPCTVQRYSASMDCWRCRGSPVGAIEATAVIHRSVWEMQSTTRAIVAYAEWVQNTVFEPGSAVLAWAVEFSRQVISSFQKKVKDGKTAYKRREQKSNRKALVPLGELVMLMPLEKPRDKGEARNRVGIMLGLVDRSDEVVTGATERVKARSVHRVPAGHDAMPRTRRASEAWKPNPAVVAEGEPLGVAQTRIVSVPMVAVEK